MTPFLIVGGAVLVLWFVGFLFVTAAIGKEFFND